MSEFLEQYYENVVLPLYGNDVTFKTITWKDHGKVGLDTFAHYFEDEKGREYVLLYEDFPGSEYLNDDLSHEIVKCGNETSTRVLTEPQKTVENITGYFTLYREKSGK